MDFFERQHTARRRTGWFLLLFMLAVAVIVAAVHLVIAAVFVGRHLLHDPKWISIDTAATLLVILAGILWTRFEYSKGGSSVAKACGGRLVLPSSREPQERRLLNVVEEMAIASGVPTPPVYILEHESGINAFAAGQASNNAVVAVSQGALDQLTRDELQGVIGHEFSHILNGDMRLNLTLAGWLGGILGLAVVGELLVLGAWEIIKNVNFGSGKSGSFAFAITLVAFVVGAGLWIIGYIGVFFARLIQAAVSRQREFLADASSVQFTRNPLGLANALKKIAGLRQGSVLKQPRASTLRHMFFSSACKASWLDFMLATHPPIGERIKWLDPGFNPEMAEYHSPASAPGPGEDDDASGEIDEDLSPEIAAIAGAQRKERPLTKHVGSPGRDELDCAKNLLLNLPATLLSASRDRHGACAITYALLLGDDDALRKRQKKHLSEVVSEPVCSDLDQVESLVRSLNPAAKLPVAILALSGLRSWALASTRNSSPL